MPTQIELNNGNIATIISPMDFCDLVNEYMGKEAYMYVIGMLNEIEELKEEVDYYK